MGNRCVVTQQDKSKAIYFHWNGGMDTIYPLTIVAKSFAEDSKDKASKWDIFKSIARNVFDAQIMPYKKCDCNNGDNGVYILDDDLNIVGREYAPEKEQDEHNFLQMICYIVISAISHQELKGKIPIEDIEALSSRINNCLYSSFKEGGLRK